MEVGDDADHMRAIAKKKKDELERAAAKMRARVEAYETVWQANVRAPRHFHALRDCVGSMAWRLTKSLDSSERLSKKTSSDGHESRRRTHWSMSTQV